MASSTVADMLPAMCGSDTLTTVVSKTSMNVLSITAMAMIHGLMCSPLGFVGASIVGTTTAQGITRILPKEPQKPYFALENKVQ